MTEAIVLTLAGILEENILNDLSQQYLVALLIRSWHADKRDTKWDIFMPCVKNYN